MAVSGLSRYTVPTRRPRLTFHGRPVLLLCTTKGKPPVRSRIACPDGRGSLAASPREFMCMTGPVLRDMGTSAGGCLYRWQRGSAELWPRRCFSHRAYAKVLRAAQLGSRTVYMTSMRSRLPGDAGYAAVIRCGGGAVCLRGGISTFGLPVRDQLCALNFIGDQIERWVFRPRQRRRRMSRKAF